MVRAKVESILARGGKVHGVRMKDGHEIHAPMVISNAGVHTTFEDLLDEDHGDVERTLARKVRPSASHVCVYLGLKGSDKDNALSRPNHWIFPS